MKQVHLSLQGKGGVGKSLIASLLAQYYESIGEPAACLDTDPVNATFAGYTALNVEHLPLLGPDKKISERKFDGMMERILTEERNFVIDNGASSFVPLSSYLVENDAAAMIAENGKQLVVHSVVTGGQALGDTVHGLNSLLEQMPASVRIVVWINEFFGPVERDGRPFEQLGVYKDNKERIHGVVRLERQSSDTFRKDLETLLDAKMTFAEALDPASDKFGLMPRQRLTQMQRSLFQRIALVV